LIDHASIPVSDLAKSAAFYDALLAPLGYARMVERPATVGFGKRFPEIWLNERKAMTRTPDDTGMHLCLRAKSEEAVRAFHQAALDGGGACDGPPGPRQAALTAYYAAFIRDLDGNKLEAARFPPPGAAS
jgi:catechol 2,3-dioxygenase-like lactoylglutathione lyase family enzyme